MAVLDHERGFGAGFARSAVGEGLRQELSCLDIAPTPANVVQEDGANALLGFLTDQGAMIRIQENCGCEGLRASKIPGVVGAC